MNREPIISDNDHVEVTLEDLFIEEYAPPLTLPVPVDEKLASSRRRRFARPRSIASLLLVSGLALVGFVFGRRAIRRRSRPWYGLRRGLRAG